MIICMIGVSNGIAEAPTPSSSGVIESMARVEQSLRNARLLQDKINSLKKVTHPHIHIAPFSFRYLIYHHLK
jgi:hypothetical protein